MRDGETVTIERLEVRLADLEKIKRALKLKDNAEAVRKGVEVAAGFSYQLSSSSLKLSR